MGMLEGKRTVVTGAGSGIGRAIASRFTTEGARVLVADINPDAAAETVSMLGSAALTFEVDVTDSSAVRAMIQRAVDAWGGLDVLVNNAGVGVAATTPNTSEEDWTRVISINLTGTFLGMKHGIPAIIASGGGSIVNISSVAAMVGVPDRAAYCAAKGGIMALTRAAAVDHVSEGIRINCIAPGTVDTPWVGRITSGYEDPEAARAAMQARQPHGRFVKPEEIASMAAYLASDDAGSIVGAVMVVDGGLTAR